jgi:SAM-dependent methyltransferase
MLRGARELRDRHHWTNIHLAEGDAADYVAPEPLHGVLFSFSYNTMAHHLTVLRRMWRQLRPGGRLVIVDSKLPHGLGGKLLLPFSLWLMRHTLLGNPYIRPWEHHAELVDNFEMEEFLLASYYVCRGVKPVTSRLACFLDSAVKTRKPTRRLPCSTSSLVVQGKRPQRYARGRVLQRRVATALRIDAAQAAHHRDVLPPVNTRSLAVTMVDE